MEPLGRARRISRRSLLQGTAAATLWLSLGGTLASACSQFEAVGSGPALATPGHPIRWPIRHGNEPIAAHQSPERDATLQILTWDQYIDPSVLKEFGKAFDCRVEVSTFFDMDEGVTKLRAGVVAADVFCPTVDVVDQLILAGDLRPLNHAYIPNLEANVWPDFVSPFYDVESRYTIPYAVYTTGIGWRNDLVAADVASMPNPYDIFWDPANKGYVYVLDDYREAIGMALLRRGVTDLNTGDTSDIARARRDLIDLVNSVSIKWSLDDYTLLPEGQAKVHQAWSGDMIEAPYYGKGSAGAVAQSLSYWYPRNHRGAIGSDTLVVPTRARHPVLAHEFLNFILEDRIAIQNFGWVGYQQPVKAIDVGTVLGEFPWVGSPNMADCLVTPQDLALGYRELQLSPQVDVLWQLAWDQFQAGG